MSKAPFALALLIAALACEGRELTVFDVQVAPLAGSAGVGGDSGSTSVSGGSGSSGGGSSGSPGSSGTPAGGDFGGFAGTDSSGGQVSTGGAGDVTPMPCSNRFDCGPGWVCQKPSCDATVGECVQWPSLCPSDPSPVCGCDGVTYWNDCIRLNSYAQLAGPEPCRESARTCDFGPDCNVPYASCSHLIPSGEMCGHSLGACWVLPPQCGPNADKKRWRECKPPDLGPPGPCVDTCTAIASERPHAELHRGELCN